jgi:hypothetical protein
MPPLLKSYAKPSACWKSEDRCSFCRKSETAEKIAEGPESLRRGDRLDGERIFDRIEAELEQLVRTGHK